MATHAEETWVRGNYNVRPLHPTLELLMWDYGALDSDQEKDYIHAKIQMLDQELLNVKAIVLAQLIAESQEFMREYALQQLRSHHVSDAESKVVITP